MNQKKYILIPILLILLLSVSLFAACSPVVYEPENNNQNTEEIDEDILVDDIPLTNIAVVDTLDPITFGKYPQTVSSSVSISKEKQSNGYYLGSYLVNSQ